jgi:hypothetical protein
MNQKCQFGFGNCVIDCNDMACETHKCKDDGCRYPKIKNPTVGLGTRYNYEYCQFHNCCYYTTQNGIITIIDCKIKRDDGSLFCVYHKCTKCVKEKSKCLEHRCKKRKCNDSHIDDTGYCIGHKCKRIGCDTDNEDNNFCYQHKCSKKMCKNECSGRFNFCMDHKCKNKKCYFGKNHHHMFCLNHKCKYDECPKEKQNWFNIIKPIFIKGSIFNRLPQCLVDKIIKDVVCTTIEQCDYHL